MRILLVFVCLPAFLLGFDIDQRGWSQAAAKEAERILAAPASATKAIAQWSAAWQSAGDLSAAQSLATLSYSYSFRQEHHQLWWLATGAVLTTPTPEQDVRWFKSGLDIQATVLGTMPLVAPVEQRQPPEAARRDELRSYLDLILPSMGWFYRWRDPAIPVSATAASLPVDKQEQMRRLIAAYKPLLDQDIYRPLLQACYRGRPDDRAELVTAMIRNGFPPAAQAELLKEIDQPWP